MSRKYVFDLSIKKRKSQFLNFLDSPFPHIKLFYNALSNIFICFVHMGYGCAQIYCLSTINYDF